MSEYLTKIEWMKINHPEAFYCNGKLAYDSFGVCPRTYGLDCKDMCFPGPEACKKCWEGFATINGEYIKKEHIDNDTKKLFNVKSQGEFFSPFNVEIKTVDDLKKLTERFNNEDIKLSFKNDQIIICDSRHSWCY